MFSNDVIFIMPYTWNYFALKTWLQECDMFFNITEFLVFWYVLSYPYKYNSSAHNIYVPATLRLQGRIQKGITLHKLNKMKKRKE